MKRIYKVNGKVTYPQSDGILTVFSFYNPETGEMMTIQTNSEDETNEFNYDDTVELTITVKKEEPITSESEIEENEPTEVVDDETTSIPESGNQG